MKSRKLLDRRGNLRVPFYHGTSSLFVESIREAGLGGRDPVETNSWVDSFRDLFQLGDQKLWEQRGWQQARVGLLPIVEQGLSKDGLRFNFSHGGTYVSPDPRMSVQYALESGCEILDYIKRLSIILCSEGLTQDVKRIMPMSLQQMLIKTYDPVLIKINGLRFRDIETENGDDKWAVLDRYTELLRMNNGTSDMTSWKLTTTIPETELEFRYL